MVGHGIDLAEHLIILAIPRAPNRIGVIGVGLNDQGSQQRRLAQVPSHRPGGGIENDRGLRVPGGAFRGHGFVGEQSQVAPGLLPGDGLAVGEQVAFRTCRSKGCAPAPVPEKAPARPRAGTAPTRPLAWPIPAWPILAWRSALADRFAVTHGEHSRIGQRAGIAHAATPPRP